jgi:hypothetical protein
MVHQRLSNRASEAGETLAELVVTVAILGIAIVALVGGLATAILASDIHRDHASGDTIARSVAELVEGRNVPWVPSGNYPASTWSSVNTAGFNVSIINQQCWSDKDTSNPPAFGNCPGPDLGLQKLTVSVTPTDGKSSAELVTFLKRRT